MSNGIASVISLRPAAAILLMTLPVAFIGCDKGVTTAPVHIAASDTSAHPAPSVRSRTDPARNRMWVISADGVFVYDASTRKLMQEVSLPAWQAVQGQYACPPDLALAPDGSVIVTSNIVPTLWKIHPDTLAVSVLEPVLDADMDKDVGFSGLAYSAAHEAFFAVSDVHGSLWRIDASFKTAQKVALSQPVREACGITIKMRAHERNAAQRSELCVQSQSGGWTVTLTPDQRSAGVKAPSCKEPPMRLAGRGK
jgi:hypothetical protein